MKKGIVMEQQSEYMIVMTSDGKFHKAEKVDDADIGMEIRFKIIEDHKVLHRWTQVLHNHYSRAAIVALVFLLALFPAFFLYGNNQAYAYMNIDINPSVELELNDKMQVIDLNPQNEEAEDIISSFEDWKKQDASEVTFQLIELSQQKGYVNESNQVLIGISYLKEEADAEYTDEIEQFLKEKSTNMTIATFLVPEELRKKAIKQKASVNEMVADKINETDSEDGMSSENPVPVEEDDREIIQSFYKKDSSDEGQEAPVDPDLKPIEPANRDLEIEKQSTIETDVEQADPLGKAKTGPPESEEKSSFHLEKHGEKKYNEKKNITNNNKKDKIHKKESYRDQKYHKSKKEDKAKARSSSKHHRKKGDQPKGKGHHYKKQPSSGKQNSSHGKHS